jgi:hypothetical protein
MSSHVGDRLQAVHTGMANTPLPEELEGASCGPAVKHLAHLAIHTAEAGGSEADWKSWVREHVPEVSDKLFAEAEECMHNAGLWPWHGRPAGPSQ